MKDESYIRLTLEIAKKGKGNVSPNPLVGCVIVKDEKIIGAGFHEKFGANHAEINAIESAKESIEGATLYVNLEPCSHHGKTPPCVERIIQEKIKRVVIGTLDMNPLVSGKGVKKLKDAGISVKIGVLEEECISLNRFFFKHIVTGMPYITLKAAITLDGKIADKHGDSKWISSLQSRKYVHELRAQYDAVLVGKNTVLKDNPELTVRLIEGRNPFKIIIDEDLSIPFDKKVFKNKEKKLIVVTSSEKKNDPSALLLEQKGYEVLYVKNKKDGTISLKNTLKEIGKRGINSVLVEGGSGVYSSLIKENLLDNIIMFIAPKFLGSGLSVINSIDVNRMRNSKKFEIANLEKIGDDILVELI